VRKPWLYGVVAGLVLILAFVVLMRSYEIGIYELDLSSGEVRVTKGYGPSLDRHYYVHEQRMVYLQTRMVSDQPANLISLGSVWSRERYGRWNGSGLGLLKILRDDGDKIDDLHETDISVVVAKLENGQVELARSLLRRMVLGRSYEDLLQ
jgi:hypothetical protein